VANELTTVLRPDQILLRQGYDRAGNVITTTDGLTQTTSYGYDSINRVITSTDPLQRVTTSGYDLSGNPATLLDPRGFL
jgi:YD repeat-containing protein